jgi:hypothetical protein
VTAAGAQADPFADAQAALEQAAAQTGGAPPPAAPAPAKREAPQAQKSWQTGGVAAPAAEPTQANVNISIRVQSPGNDGPTIQQNETGSSADFDRLERDLKHELDVKLQEMTKEVATPSPARMVSPVRQVASKPPPVHKRVFHASAKPAPVRRVVRVIPAARPLPRARPPAHRAHKTRATHHKTPFKLPPAPQDQAMSAGSSGGTSTPPPALVAVLLAAACFAASMLVTLLWDAHRRRRSRLFASRLERPG